MFITEYAAEPPPPPSAVRSLSRDGLMLALAPCPDMHRVLVNGTVNPSDWTLGGALPGFMSTIGP